MLPSLARLAIGAPPVAAPVATDAAESSDEDDEPLAELAARQWPAVPVTNPPKKPSKKPSKKPLPSLDDDLKQSVLAAIRDDYADHACNAASCWSMLNHAHWNACKDAVLAWKALSSANFAGAPAIVEGRARANFYAQCRFAMRAAFRFYSSDYVMGPKGSPSWKIKSYVIHAVRADPGDGRRLSEALQDDADVVLAAVRETGRALQHASKRLRGDASIALVAVSDHGYALECVEDPARSNRKVVLAAVTNEGRALKCARDLWASCNGWVSGAAGSTSVLEHLGPGCVFGK